MKDINTMKNTSVDVLELSVRSSNYLKNLKINTIGELTSKNDLENPFVISCWSEHKAEKGIIVALSMLGLHLGMNDDDWQKWSTTEVNLPLPEEYYRNFFYNTKFETLQDTFQFIKDYLNIKGLVKTCYTDITQNFDAEATTRYICFNDINKAISFYSENFETMTHVMILIEDDETTLMNSKKRIEETYNKNNLQTKSLYISIVPNHTTTKIRMIYQKLYS